MSVLFVVFPVAILIAAAAVAAFIWAVRGGQMDDLETPAMRMLHDDEEEGGPSAEMGPGEADTRD